tara:strand:- start:766 stop:1386 length:621 start_codon:yes stop_codon:yes gene_type:complete
MEKRNKKDKLSDILSEKDGKNEDEEESKNKEDLDSEGDIIEESLIDDTEPFFVDKPKEEVKRNLNILSNEGSLEREVIDAPSPFVDEKTYDEKLSFPEEEERKGKEMYVLESDQAPYESGGSNQPSYESENVNINQRNADEFYEWKNKTDPNDRSWVIDANLNRKRTISGEELIDSRDRIIGETYTHQGVKEGFMSMSQEKNYKTK